MPSEKREAPRRERFYTFAVSVSFEIQFTFQVSGVQQAEEGGEGEFDPTDEALGQLKNELSEYLSQQYSIQHLEAFADSDSLLGVVEDSTL